MINTIALYESGSTDPYRNLATEQYLLESAEDRCILYLWQNECTVVIGRNQNPWKECRITLLEQEGGHLARRLSGGGAVFHDLGNLNFTLLMPQQDFDLERQLSVICKAVCSLGIPAEKSGRNDVLVDGRKFSGNAFYKNGKQAYHHGTLLVDADLSNMSRYLNPSKAKLQSKGVDSVRSRVVNLRELNPEITVSALKEALIDAFQEVYGLPLHRILDGELDEGRIGALAERNSGWEWNYGHKMPFTMEREARFSWGCVQVQLRIDSGRIQQARVYSDAMDWALIPELEGKLNGCRFDSDSLRQCLKDSESPEAADICRMLWEDCL